jgi:hypothetical protein
MAPVTLLNLAVGDVGSSGLRTAYDTYALAMWPRALTDAEVAAASSAMVTAAGATITPRRFIWFAGTSISAGNDDTKDAIGNEGFANNCIPNLSPAALGYNDALSGSAFFQFDVAKLNAMKANAIANGALVTDWVLHIEFGANEGAGLNLLAANLAVACDSARAAGWKVVVATVLPRNDAGDGGADFNAKRATHNATVRTWVGVHCNAVSDIGGHAIMGLDATANDPTYFSAGKVHPNHTGHGLLEPVVRAAINSV